jgi:replicative DNA helicase
VSSEQRTPPHDLLAEQSVLGGMMLSAAAIGDVMGEMKPADHYVPKHEIIHEAILELAGKGEPTDAIAVGDELTRTGKIREAGGDPGYLHTLTSTVPTAANAGYYAHIVANKAVLRRLIVAGTRITQMGYSSEGDVNELLGAAREQLDAAETTAPSKVRYVRDILPDVVERLQTNATFVPTPWPSLNRLIGGLRPGAVYVIAARPGVGKTVIASQLAACLADYGRVAFSSLEMSEDDLVSRLISERLNIRVGKVKDNRMTDYDWKVLADGRAQLNALNIAIDDRAAVTAVEVRAFAKAVSRQGTMAGVVVDYLQLMSSRSKLDRHLQVSEFSRQLKITAKDMHLPVIALSQLNRQSESRADGVPRLSDLRESGAIEQDADVVILLRREELDGHTFENPRESSWLDVAKNRHGETGEVELAWQGEFSRAVEW